MNEESKLNVVAILETTKTIVVPEIQIDITGFMSAAENLIVQAERAEITDADSYATGGDLIKIARVQSQKAEELRKKVGAPFLKLTKFINAGFKPIAAEFSKAQLTISTKMSAWQREEDIRLRVLAEEEKKRLEAEAIERALLEKTEEAQDEVLEAAAEAADQIVDKSGVGLQRGNFGSSTGTRKVYSTDVTNIEDFLGGLLHHIEQGNKRNLDLGSIVDLRQSGLNSLAKSMVQAGVKKMPGAEFKVVEMIAVY